jgi:thioredoxin reductase
MELPRLTTHYESNVPGLYIVGELGGMGLIRNAVKQGRLAVEHASQTLAGKGTADCEILVVGAGPAGLSATLGAIAARKSYVCIEQNSFGGTVYNFPRQKVVMSHPADLPIFGPMRFPSNKVSKEDLLTFWNYVRKKTDLKVNEECKFIKLEKRSDLFAVETSRGLVTARRVVLAMGVRGTPRRLGIEGESLPKVTYNLLEPEQYQRCNIVVVGGGNAGVEAAQQLAQPQYRNRVTLLVRSAVFDRCNQENQNIIFALAKKGLVDIRFESNLKYIARDHVVYEQKARQIKIGNDFVFVFAGAEMPFKFLQSLGIVIDKKFGEPVRKA